VIYLTRLHVVVSPIARGLVTRCMWSVLPESAPAVRSGRITAGARHARILAPARHATRALS